MAIDHTSPSYHAMIAFRCLVEHPLEVAKLRNQKFPNQSSLDTIIKIFKTSGFSGFCSGGVANLTRKWTKEHIRWGVIDRLHPFARSHHLEGIPLEISKAIGISLIETGIIQPVERLLNAQVNEKGYSAFFDRLKNEGFPLLYKGASISLSRRILGWSSFMTINHLVKREVKVLDPENNHAFAGSALASAVTAVSLTTICLPFEFFYTQLSTNEECRNMKTLQGIRYIFRTARFPHLYAGFWFNLGQSFVQAAIGGKLLDKISSHHA